MQSTTGGARYSLVICLAELCAQQERCTVHATGIDTEVMSIAVVVAGKGSNKKTTLYVGGLEENVNEAILHSAFIPFGDIKDVNIPLDNTTGQHRGFGFVEYENAEVSTAVWAAHLCLCCSMVMPRPRMKQCRIPPTARRRQCM